MKFFLYQGRSGGEYLVPHDKRHWDFLVAAMEEENRITFEQAQEQGFEIGGSYEEGHLYMDDGGEIHTIELTEV